MDLPFIDIAGLIGQLKSMAANNQFLSGGLVLGALTGLIAVLRNVPRRVMVYLKNKIITTVIIEKEDSFYHYCSQWFSQFERLQAKTRNLKMNCDWHEVDSPEAKALFVKYPDLKKKAEESGRPNIPVARFEPGYGYHWFWHGGRFIVVNHIENKPPNGNTAAQKGGYHFTFFTRDRAFIEQFFQHIATYDIFTPKTKIDVFVRTPVDGWRRVASRSPRALDSVVLDTGIKQEVIDDILRFRSSERWYRERGIPYRKGYLFEGPPGSGKSSFVLALAGYLNTDICVIDLNDPTLNDSNLATTLMEACADLILIEDIDAVGMPKRDEKRPKKEKEDETFTRFVQGVTFAGLLNALDGVAAQEGKIVIMTTNFVDRLDEALIRPGRCDRIFRLDHATHAQFREIYSRFFPDESAHADAFANQFPERVLSMARIQEHLMRHWDNPVAARENTDHLRRLAALELEKQGAKNRD